MKPQNLILFAALVLGTSSARADIVTNGSFEQGTLGIGSFQGWQTDLGDISTFVDSTGITGPLWGDAFDGLWAAYFGSTAADGGASISQTLATKAGQEYLLSFELANDNAGAAPINSFVVSVDSTQAFSFTNLADQPYAAHQYLFTASSDSTLLTFFGSNEASYLKLDDVAVDPVPEPATLTLLGGTLLTLVSLRQRRAAR